MNLTLAIDDQVLKAARKVAIDHHTTLAAMIRAYLEQVAAQEQQDAQRVLRSLRAAFAASTFAGAEVRPTRDELHER
jgi:hypothetical protein